VDALSTPPRFWGFGWALRMHIMYIQPWVLGVGCFFSPTRLGRRTGPADIGPAVHAPCPMPSTLS
jgi:hypothetical protein